MMPIPPPSDDDSVTVDSDGPGDNTRRPCRPERRALLEKERELLHLYGMKREGANGEPPT
jgi:hypothetical protein